MRGGSSVILLTRDSYFQTRDQPIYKLCVSKNNNSRNPLTCGYVSCNDTTIFESVLADFKELYIHRPDVGERYFYGDVTDMMTDMTRLVLEREKHATVSPFLDP